MPGRVGPAGPPPTAGDGQDVAGVLSLRTPGGRRNGRWDLNFEAPETGSTTIPLECVSDDGLRKEKLELTLIAVRGAPVGIPGSADGFGQYSGEEDRYDGCTGDCAEGEEEEAGPLGAQLEVGVADAYTLQDPQHNPVFRGAAGLTIKGQKWWQRMVLGLLWRAGESEVRDGRTGEMVGPYTHVFNGRFAWQPRVGPIGFDAGLGGGVCHTNAAATRDGGKTDPNTSFCATGDIGVSIGGEHVRLNLGEECVLTTDGAQQACGPHAEIRAEIDF